MDNYSMLIDGKWTDSVSKERFPVINPANGEVVAEAPSAETPDAPAGSEAVIGAEGVAEPAPELAGDDLSPDATAEPSTGSSGGCVAGGVPAAGGLLPILLMLAGLVARRRSPIA